MSVHVTTQKDTYLSLENSKVLRKTIVDEGFIPFKVLNSENIYSSGLNF